jgi:hypothetical protein
MIYTIEKNKHKSTPRVFKLWLGRKKFNFKFSLSNNCWYPKDSIEYEGISKICGVSFGIHTENPFGKIPIIKNLVNSVVIGWVPKYDNKNCYSLYIINDNKGVETRLEWPIPTFSDQDNEVIIERRGKYVVVIINKVGKLYNINSKYGFGYYLGFYHGGKSTAPQTMECELEIL